MFSQSNVVKLESCLACGSKDLQFVLDLNTQPLANSYKIKCDEVQEEYPLAINHCKNCHHVQLTHMVNPDLMFKDYLYVTGTSQTMKDHCWWFANYSTEYFKTLHKHLPVNAFDIGCNDGTQLDYYKKLGILTYGIDPAENLHEQASQKHEVYLGYFNIDFLDVTREFDYDIIVAQNVFAHNYDPYNFLRAAKEIMHDKSLMFIQTSQSDMIVNNEFDTIYHEHISYYNIKSMNELCKRSGLNLIDVVKCPLHGSSYIFVISPTVDRKFNIYNMIDMERRNGLYNDLTYVKYAERCKNAVSSLKNVVESFRDEGWHIVGYGAAAKGMTLLNCSDIKLDFIVDDNKLKQGRFTPGLGTPIVPSSEIKNIPNDGKNVLFIPLAWNFFDEIRNKIKLVRNNSNDLFIKYFPEVNVTK